MNITNLIAALFLTATLLATGSARAEEPAPKSGDTKFLSRPGAARHAQRHRQKMEELEALRKALNLKSDQETAWNDWQAKWRGDRGNLMNKREALANLDALPAIEQMEKKLAFFRERLAKQEERIAATKAFYATLSPEQKQIFDTRFKPWPGRQGGPQSGAAEDSE
jgi:Spy/CpxP family protein refolding chaperone